MSAMAQLAFDLTHPESYRPEDFLLSESNREAHQWIGQWPNWPGNTLVLEGPSGSGKTHLAHLWAERSHAHFLAPLELGTAPTPALLHGASAIVLDGLENIRDDTALFHLLNYVKETGTSLLICSDRPLSQLSIALKDTTSRLTALQWVKLHEPDELLLTAVLTKLFADQQLRVGKEVIEYLVRRMERSFAAALKWAARINQQAWERGKPITLSLVRSLMSEDGIL